MIDLRATFDKYEDTEGCNWKKVSPQRSLRSDLHAFLLLDHLMPGHTNIVLDANHEIIYFGIDIDKLAEVITEEQVIELIRCGVFYNHDLYRLSMFV